jgi:hypothetical protein
MHNPITRFLLLRLAQPSREDQFTTALARLAGSYKGQERLKPYLLSLYETNCPGCGSTLPAKSFTWSRSKKIPVQKTCLCPHCLETSETDLTEEDLQKALAFRESSPTQARALTRVAPPDDPIRFQVENALGAYPPRSLYALFTILNKLTGFDLANEERYVLETLLLNGFYRCSGPGGDPEEDLYQEENVWYALEETPQTWKATDRSLPVTAWPELPPESGGICIFPDRVRELLGQLSGNEIEAVWMTFPKPTLSYWALSALWTGWLWGQEAAEPLHNVLRGQEFSWGWLTRAIASTISSLWEVLPEDTPCFGLIPEVDTNSLVSSIAAAASGGLNLISITLDPDLLQSQTLWLPKGQLVGDEPDPDLIRESIRTAGFDLLQTAGEPQSTLSLYAAGLESLASKELLPGYEGADLLIMHNQLEQDFEENIAYRQGFLHFPRSDSWWHQEMKLSQEPDSDRVEQTLVQILVDADSPLAEDWIYNHLYLDFSGLQTPRSGLIEVCLSSYGEQIGNNPPEWRIKSSDLPGRRRQDIQEIQQIITNLGNQLGYITKEKPPLGGILDTEWLIGDEIQERFFITVTGNLNKIIAQGNNIRGRKWVILPGSRAELIHYKLRNNPPLASEVDAGWGLIKFRHIRRLAEEGGLTRENLAERLKLDPFTSDSPQLKLI